MYDLIIIGADPAGMAAGITAAEKKLKALVLSKDVFEPKGESFALGIFKLAELRKKFDTIVVGNILEFYNKTEVLNLEKNIVSFSLETKRGEVYYAKAVIIATSNHAVDFDTLTQKTSNGIIKVDAELKTSVPGIWAVGGAIVSKGDMADPVIAIGEGVKAVLSIVQKL